MLSSCVDLQRWFPSLNRFLSRHPPCPGTTSFCVTDSKQRIPFNGRPFGQKILTGDKRWCENVLKNRKWRFCWRIGHQRRASSLGFYAQVLGLGWGIGAAYQLHWGHQAHDVTFATYSRAAARTFGYLQAIRCDHFPLAQNRMATQAHQDVLRLNLSSIPAANGLCNSLVLSAFLIMQTRIDNTVQYLVALFVY
jgi:hypothetical protein